MKIKSDRSHSQVVEAAATAGAFPRRRHCRSAKNSGEFETSGKVRPNYQRYKKPPYSYVGLIAAAIWASDRQCLSLAEIINAMRKMFTFFSVEGSYKGWQDSVRHNLSQNPCFLKVLRDPLKPRAKGNLWAVDWEKLPDFAFKLQHNDVSKTGDYADNLLDQLGLKETPSPFSSPPDVRKAARNLHLMSDHPESSELDSSMSSSLPSTPVTPKTPRFFYDSTSPDVTPHKSSGDGEPLTPGAQLCQKLRRDFSIQRLLDSTMESCNMDDTTPKANSTSAHLCTSELLTVATDSVTTPLWHLPSPFWGASHSPASSDSLSPAAMSFATADFWGPSSPTIHWFAKSKEEVTITTTPCEHPRPAILVTPPSVPVQHTPAASVYPDGLVQHSPSFLHTAMPKTRPAPQVYLTPSDTYSLPNPHLLPYHPPPFYSTSQPVINPTPSNARSKSPLEDFADLALTYASLQAANPAIPSRNTNGL